MKRGIVAGVAIFVLGAMMIITIVHCDSDGGSSCSSYCRKYGECLEEGYEDYYYNDGFDWTIEHQRECVIECKEWRQDLDDDEEVEVYYCVLGCRKEADCDDFYECRSDCYDYEYYYD